jgi:enhancing lycopene biosynthesis protein 2
MKTFAVVLSGCGVFDGSEIHEATLALLAIAQHGAKYDIYAPDVEQHHVINHITGKEMPESRNVLIESARIARGKISPLKDFHAESCDAILFPGGFGAAKNLSSFAFDGAGSRVDPDVERAILDMHQKGKPIGALCIAPAVIARVIQGATVTVGDDEGTVKAIESMGGVHENTTHGEVTVDKENKIYTTPCYMLDATIIQIYMGALNVVKAILDDME